MADFAQTSSVSSRDASDAQGTLPFLDAEFTELAARTPVFRGFDQAMVDLLTRTWGEAASAHAPDVSVETFLLQVLTFHADALERAGVENPAELAKALVLYLHERKSNTSRTQTSPEGAHDLAALLHRVKTSAHDAERPTATVTDLVVALEDTIVGGHTKGPGLQALARVWPRLSKPDTLAAILAKLTALEGNLESMRREIHDRTAPLATEAAVAELRAELRAQAEATRGELAALDERWSDPRGKAKKPNKNAGPLGSRFVDQH